MAVGYNRMAILLLVAAALWRCSSAATYTVGDALGWTVPPNPTTYSDWASTKMFVVGDILVFNFASGRHDVTEVTKSAFDSCSGGNSITVENNSPARIALTAAGDHHFICNFPGHCNNSQKLSITVRATSASAPQPTSSSPSPVSVPAPSPVSVPVPTPSLAPNPSSSARSPSPTPSPSLSSPVPSPTPSREPMTYVVGDSMGWSIPTSQTFYDSWARDNTFFVGDVLEFNFMIQTHDVAKVTKENFASCSSASPISISTNPPVRITLSESGEHFFICTFAGHCRTGQKLVVNVTAADTTATPPSIATPPFDTVPSTPTPTIAPPPPSVATSLRASAFSSALLVIVVALV